MKNSPLPLMPPPMPPPPTLPAAKAARASFSLCTFSPRASSIHLAQRSSAAASIPLRDPLSATGTTLNMGTALASSSSLSLPLPLPLSLSLPLSLPLSMPLSLSLPLSLPLSLSLPSSEERIAPADPKKFLPPAPAGPLSSKNESASFTSLHRRSQARSRCGD